MKMSDKEGKVITDCQLQCSPSLETVQLEKTSTRAINRKPEIIKLIAVVAPDIGVCWPHQNLCVHVCIWIKNDFIFVVKIVYCQ